MTWKRYVNPNISSFSEQLGNLVATVWGILKFSKNDTDLNFEILRINILESMQVTDIGFIFLLGVDGKYKNTIGF